MDKVRFGKVTCISAHMVQHKQDKTNKGQDGRMQMLHHMSLSDFVRSQLACTCIQEGNNMHIMRTCLAEPQKSIFIILYTPSKCM